MLRHRALVAASRTRAGVRAMSGQADPAALRMMAARGSPGVLVDPYVPSDELSKPSMLSASYWGDMYRDSREALRSGLARGRMQRAMPDFSPSAFPAQAEKIFRSVQDAYSIGDQSLMRPLVAEHMLSALKRNMKSRNFKANVRHAARVLNFEEPTKVVQYRQLMQASTQVEMFHAQITVRFVARYAIGEYNRRGEYAKDATELADDFDLSAVLPLLDQPTLCPWRVAKDDSGNAYYFNVDTRDTRWRQPRLFVDEPAIYAGSRAAAETGGAAGDADPLGMRQAPSITAPLSVVRETYAVFERPAFLPDASWRVMVMYTPLSATDDASMGQAASSVIKGTQTS